MLRDVVKLFAHIKMTKLLPAKLTVIMKRKMIMNSGINSSVARKPGIVIANLLLQQLTNLTYALVAAAAFLRLSIPLSAMQDVYSLWQHLH